MKRGSRACRYDATACGGGGYIYIYCNRIWGGAPVTALSKRGSGILFGSVVPLQVWERHYKLLPVGCWGPAGGQAG